MFTFPVRIPLKMAMASEWDKPCVEWPFTDKISSPKNLTKKNSKLVAEFFFQGQSKKKKNQNVQNNAAQYSDCCCCFRTNSF